MSIKKKSMSFLLGAGFSVPAGYPTGKELGEKILESARKENLINLDDYIIGISHKNHIDFLSDVLAVCRDCKLPFNYEQFYDRIKSDNACFDIGLNAIFQAKYCSEPLFDLNYYLEQIDEYYNQLVANNLKCKNGKEKTIDYKRFVRLINRLKKRYTINVHTLNHDLLFENLFVCKYSDGFTRQGNAYRFCNVFNKDIRLYKLHGSVNHYRCYKRRFQSHEIEENKKRIRLPKNVNINTVKNDTDSIVVNYHPDFLTGTNFKIGRYEEPFYSDMLSHFKANLEEAEKLIVIGYSGNDAIINKHIRCLNSNASCFVLDYDEKQANLIIDRIGLNECGINSYAIKHELWNIKKTDFRKSNYLY